MRATGKVTKGLAITSKKTTNKQTQAAVRRQIMLNMIVTASSETKKL